MPIEFSKSPQTYAPRDSTCPRLAMSTRAAFHSQYIAAEICLSGTANSLNGVGALRELLVAHRVFSPHAQDLRQVKGLRLT